jgi:NAD-dependent dihydropyrimidine dehydrogenase PreA subunit
MSTKWYPVINYDTCIECAACCDFCSNGVYSLEQSKPVVTNPDLCEEGCKGCEPICPTESIRHFGDDSTIPEVKCDCNCGCNGGCC